MLHECLRKIRGHIMDLKCHLHYSPDLALFDYHVFLQLKKNHPKGMKFLFDFDIIASTGARLEAQTSKFLKKLMSEFYGCKIPGNL